MSEYYNSLRTRNLFDPDSKESFKLSRSKIDLFVECPRCFYLDRRLGVGRPPGFPFALNSAVDALLKKEFDIHRANETTHPMMKAYKIDAVPFQNEKINEWRNNFKGIQFLHKKTNFLIFGAIDDVWINFKKELHIVDYKATSKDDEVNLDAEWQDGYKRQMEIYRWLFINNGFKVSDTGYFVYANGKKDRAAFDARLEFDVKIIPYKSENLNWIEKVLVDMKKCLIDNRIPKEGKRCDYCPYRDSAVEVVERHKKFNVRDKNENSEKNSLF
ncbi:MAG: PD-(D/E)XK nuclease family protein [Patescibacteria group bacterium]